MSLYVQVRQTADALYITREVPIRASPNKCNSSESETEAITDIQTGAMGKWSVAASREREREREKESQRNTNPHDAKRKNGRALSVTRRLAT